MSLADYAEEKKTQRLGASINKPMVVVVVKHAYYITVS